MGFLYKSIAIVGGYIVKISIPIIILLVVVSSLFYSTCKDTRNTWLCGPYQNGRLEEVSETFLIVSCLLITFPICCLGITVCLMEIVGEGRLSEQNSQDSPNP